MDKECKAMSELSSLLFNKVVTVSVSEDNGTMFEYKVHAAYTSSEQLRMSSELYTRELAWGLYSNIYWQ